MKDATRIRRARTLLGISVFWLALSMISDGFAVLVVPLRISGLIDPAWAATAIGLITFVALLAGMLVQPIAGAISDRAYPAYGREGMLLVGAALVLLALALFAAFDSLAGALVATVLLFMAANVAQAAQQAFIPDQVAVGWRGRAAGAKGLADVGGAFIGFLLLGALLVDGDVRLAVIALAVVVVVTALATIVLVREQPIDRAPFRPPPLLGAYTIAVGRHGPFVRVVIARFLFLLGIFIVGRFFLLLTAERLGLDPSTAATAAAGLLAALTLITALVALPAGWLADRYGRGKTMVAGAALSAAGVLLLLTAWSAEAILVFGGLMATGSAAFSSANWALASDLVPANEAARFLGLANFGTAGAAAAAGLIGPLVDLTRGALPSLGYGSVLLAAVVPLVLSGIVALAFLRPAPISVPGLLEESRSS